MNGKWTGYVYDALGQLIRVNDRSDTRSGSSGSVWTYEYDQGGNILSKKRYPYAEPTADNVLETTTFTYGNPNWKDQLTAVNGVPISCDAIGNPLNDGTWQYEWVNGRQLARIYSVDTDASFVYNENGLRVQKTVNGVVTKYTLHGKNVVHMTQGENELHFFYDAQNKPAIVVFNGVPYSYVKNLQGDIVALLDSTGTVVVNYVYDAWGRPISKTGSLASTLGSVQPFRYRGYVYDEEIELYYLQSRFFNATAFRFINADVLCLGNMYAYCCNVPTMRVDVDGQESKLLTVEDIMNKRWCKVTFEISGAAYNEYLDAKQARFRPRRPNGPLNDYVLDNGISTVANYVSGLFTGGNAPENNTGISAIDVSFADILDYAMYRHTYDDEVVMGYVIYCLSEMNSHVGYDRVTITILCGSHDHQAIVKLHHNDGTTSTSELFDLRVPNNSYTMVEELYTIFKRYGGAIRVEIAEWGECLNE